MIELKDYDIMDIEAMDDERLEKSESGKIQATRVYMKSEADKVIAELNDKLRHHPMMAAFIEGDNKKIRRLKRALYKAIANWAHHRVFVRFKTNEKAWEKVERKCRAKMEEYK